MLTTILSTILAPQLPPAPVTGTFLERAVVVQDESLTPLELLLVPTGPGITGPELLSSYESRFANSEMLPQQDPTKPPFKILGFSSGTSRIIGTDDGRADVIGAEADWGFMLFVVTNHTSPCLPIYLAEQSSAGGIAADIFSYIYPGSSLDSDFLDTVEKVRDGSDMGLTAIRDLDFNLPVYALSPDIIDTIEGAMDTFYFTLHPDCLPYADPEWYMRDPSNPNCPVQLSSASILKIVFDAGAGEWSRPQLHLGYDDLHLQETDVALSLSVDRTAHKVLLGLDSDDRQLWFGNFGLSWTDNPLYCGNYLDAAGNGNFATTQLGVSSTGRFRGICNGDPGDGDGIEEVLAEKTWGKPEKDPTLTREGFNVAVSRAYDRLRDEDQLHIRIGNLACVSRGDPALVEVMIDNVSVARDSVTTMDPLDISVFEVPIPTYLPPGTTVSVWINTAGQYGISRSHGFSIVL